MAAQEQATVNLSWPGQGTVVKYRIYHLSDGKIDEKVADGPSPLTIPDLTPNTMYSKVYEAVAVMEDGNESNITTLPDFKTQAWRWHT